MRTRHNIIASAFAFLIIATSALAQLGPKDGVGLIATELDRVKVGQPAHPGGRGRKGHHAFGLARQEIGRVGILSRLLVTLLSRTAREAEKPFDQTAERESANPSREPR
jgi:hypothetical protein